MMPRDNFEHDPIRYAAWLKRQLPPDDGCVCPHRPATTHMQVVDGHLEVSHTTWERCSRCHKRERA